MRFYWADLMWKFAIANKNQDNRWFNGNVQFWRKEPEQGRNTVSEDEVMDKDGDFFGITCFFNRNVDPDVISNFDFCQERNVTDLDSKTKGHLHLGQDDEYLPNPFSRPKLLEKFAWGYLKPERSSSRTRLLHGG
ncbi:hypothetical protein FCULG_00007188 [Fusarium culmorum]|uniref:Uncharacterized protein n=1 Tax=Fusarium culmorum TaxID=5516 RepID=A0A2T4GSN1_FUSCU|nr:hypothetical protein FCULG_00007188 [Fusarium culmorum]